jgi:hypothetical protein
MRARLTRSGRLAPQCSDRCAVQPRLDGLKPTRTCAVWHLDVAVGASDGNMRERGGAPRMCRCG